MKRAFLFSTVLGLAAGGWHESMARYPQADAHYDSAAAKSPTLGKIPFAPFGLEADAPLDKIEVTLAFQSAKTGAGKQEIALRGDGSVRLFFSRSDRDKAPRTLEGRCDPEAIIRLLDFMEGNGLGDASGRTAGARGRSRRILQVTLPHRTMRVSLGGPGDYSLEQMIGAVKLTAGQCLPEALNHRFFPNL